MQALIKLGLAALFSVTSSVHALNPIFGGYGGILLGGNYTPNVNFTFTNPITHLINEGVLGYSYLGNVGGQMGYRCEKFRIEGELFYNNSPYGSLTLGRIKLQGSQGASTGETSGLMFEGSTDTISVMLNGFYDLLSADGLSNFVPYAGIGVGYSRVQNRSSFSLNGSGLLSTNPATTLTTPSGQAIIGASYFLDDYTSFSLDFRYLRSKSNMRFMDAPLQLFTLNLLFNGAFNFD